MTSVELFMVVKLSVCVNISRTGAVQWAPSPCCFHRTSRFSKIFSPPKDISERPQNIPCLSIMRNASEQEVSFKIAVL